MNRLFHIHGVSRRGILSELGKLSRYSASKMSSPQQLAMRINCERLQLYTALAFSTIELTNATLIEHGHALNLTDQSGRGSPTVPVAQSLNNRKIEVARESGFILGPTTMLYIPRPNQKHSVQYTHTDDLGLSQFAKVKTTQ